MSDMSQAQGPVGRGMDMNSTDDMVPPAAQSGRDPDSEHVGPQDLGSEDVGSQDYGADDVNLQDIADTNEPPNPAGVPLPRGRRQRQRGEPAIDAIVLRPYARHGW
jgi:hypothetical protein